MVDLLKKHKQELVFSSIALLIVILDQSSKYLAQLLKPKVVLWFLTIQYIQNTGAGFGILKDQTSILTIVSFLVALGVILMYKKIPGEKTPQFLFAIFLGGVLGNFIDRLFRSYVIDFIDLSFWPAFNIADAAISVAVVGLVVYFWGK